MTFRKLSLHLITMAVVAAPMANLGAKPWFLPSAYADDTVPAAPVPAAVPSPAPVERETGYGKVKGIAGSFLFGPSVTLMSFPHPVGLGLEAKYRNLFGASVGYNFIPELNIQKSKIELNSSQVTLRWFPFRGAFFVGAAIGNQEITAKKSTQIQGVTVNGTVEIKSSFYTPHVGWRWVWDTGFFMGLDLGWQIASGVTTRVTTDADNPLLLATSQYRDLQSEVEKVGNDWGRKPLPSATLLQFGWLF